MPDAYVIDLLNPELMLRYQRSPSLFRKEVLARATNEWIVVDEIQRVPQLLDEVHFSMEQKGYKKFGLTGSSARKFKRGAANLLAGRAVLRNLFPLTTREMSVSVNLEQLMRFGALPMSVTAADDAAREDFLRAYVTVYLNEEIKAEALVRNLGSFARFLEVATLSAGRTMNVRAWRGTRPFLARPPVATSTCSSTRSWAAGCQLIALAPRSRSWPYRSSTGLILECCALPPAGSINRCRSISRVSFWSISCITSATPSGSEVDFIFWRGQRAVAIEVKHGRQYRPEYRKGIASLLEGMNADSYIVYRGDRELEVQGTRVIPVESFLERLHVGSVID